MAKKAKAEAAPTAKPQTGYRSTGKGDVTPRAQVMEAGGTTNALFPELADRDNLAAIEQEEGILSEPETQPEEEVNEAEPVQEETAKSEVQAEPENLEAQGDEAAEPPPTEQPEEPTAEGNPEEDFIDLAAFGLKKVKTKVNGKEVTATVQDVVDRFQLAEHLGQVGNRIGEERKALAEERRKAAEERAYLENLRRGKPEQADAYVSDEPTNEMTPLEKRLLQERQQFMQELKAIREGTQDTIHESNRRRLAKEMESQGFTDFLDFIPRMQAHLATVEDDQLRAFYDTAPGAKALYYELKAKDVALSQKAPAQAAAPVRPKAPIVKIPTPSTASRGITDDMATKQRAALERAKKTSSPDDWNEVLASRGFI